MTSMLLERVVADAATPSGRIVDATLRCIARWGWSKTTIDDIAREAGVGRATLYRLYPGGRDAVLAAVLATETGRMLARLDRSIAGATDLEDVIVGLATEARRALAGHAALQFVIAHEPEVILPHISFQQMDGVLRVVAASVGPRLEPWLGPPADPEVAARGAEWIARIVLSYLFAPSPTVDFDDVGSVRRFVRTYVVPGLAPALT